MYRLYLEKYEPELVKGQTPRAKEWLYRKIFNEEFIIMISDIPAVTHPSSLIY